MILIFGRRPGDLLENRRLPILQKPLSPLCALCDSSESHERVVKSRLYILSRAGMPSNLSTWAITRLKASTRESLKV